VRSELIVNGESVAIEGPNETPLLWVLRDDAGRLGTKYGCGLEQCGACRVLIDGVPQSSCTLAVGDVVGRSVTTIEGLVDGPVGARVVAALLARNAGQCGYCLPGIAVTLTHLVDKGSTMDRRQIAEALDTHLCRCGSQPRILAAALDLLAP
jgi:aerobic-type carbon monoxide dehydrogenase small subunit (CoxS/CutS family)